MKWVRRFEGEVFAETDVDENIIYPN